MTAFSIREFADAVTVRGAAKRLALENGFGCIPSTKIAIAVSELATNIVKYAGNGEIVLEVDRVCFTVTAIDHGPGIKDLALAFRDNCTDSKELKEDEMLDHEGFGCGLSAVKRLMDFCEVRTAPGKGTVIKAGKYVAAVKVPKAKRTVSALVAL